ncbi:hypothetical protein BC940DRAFT_313848 [Gongronella butleri]|nr:hypothetical protein BC940DRAFT_313848 [Gongronella butleri]
MLFFSFFSVSLFILFSAIMEPPVFKVITAKYFQEVLSSPDISDEEKRDFVLILQPFVDAITDKDGHIKIQKDKCFAHLLDIDKDALFEKGGQIKIQL